MITFNFHIDQHDHGELQKLAHEAGVSAAALLRLGVKQMLKQSEAVKQMVAEEKDK
jgi:DNA-binding MurR/RpiR family transcriptional regulator